MSFLDSLGGRSDAEKGFHEKRILTTDILVIAGDFFDFWFEKKGIIYPEYHQAVDQLIRLRNAGVRIILCEGNHDFFLGDYFAKKLGMEVCTQEILLDMGGLRIHVSHGDTVDRANRRYLALRGFLRSDISYRLQRALPLQWLWRVAQFSSGMSQAMSRGAQEKLVEVMYRFAVERYDRGIDAVVLGHSHEAMLREEWLGGKQRTFALLGDWIEHHTYLVFENGSFAMRSFSTGELCA